MWCHLHRKKVFKGKTIFSSVTTNMTSHITDQVPQTDLIQKLQESFCCLRRILDWAPREVHPVVDAPLWSVYHTGRFTHAISSYSVAVQVKALQNRNRKQSCNWLDTLCWWQDQATVILFETLYILLTILHIVIYAGGIVYMYIKNIYYII